MAAYNVTAMLTCFNRKSYTLNCIRSLVDGNPDVNFRFVITDDNSNDGTVEELEKLAREGQDIVILHGDGQLFWNGGMSKALDYCLNSDADADYYMLVNDDVDFAMDSIWKLIQRQRKYPDSVVVGATADRQGNISYGGVKLLSKYFAKFSIVSPSEEYKVCDTFNGNCVLIPKDVFYKVGNLDPVYIHSMSDYDYGMTITRKGYVIYNSEDVVGTCNDNDVSGSWRDTSLPRKVRLQKKESPKGLPRKDWFHFINKNYGFLSAVYHTMTPYVRILLRK